MRVLVTRPVREAQSWIQALTSAGHDPVGLPLIEIAPVADLQALHREWQQIGRHQAIMFVSANAVDFFFAAKPESASSIFSNTHPSIRAWVTGPSTARALVRGGASTACIDMPKPESSQFDSESLWAEVHAQVNAGSRVLIVRGEEASADANSGAMGNGRDWLAQRICEAGGSIDFLVVYQRQVPVFTPLQQHQVRAASTDGSVWLFSSSQAIANLAGSFPAQSWAKARAVATHPRIAQTARSHGFGVVCESRPMLVEVIASIESVG
jgi:uroporphyrinogen-III synthase